MLKVGDQLPHFETENQDGIVIKSDNFAGKKLVIFFYPQASTPTCTVEACNLRDHYTELQEAGYEIVGVSGDAVKKQKNFHTKNSFPFSLLADEKRELIELFGVWKEKKTFGKTYMGTVRTTFIFDEKGICTRVIEKVTSKTAAQQILEEI